MKWQNLIDKKCPRCDSPLERESKAGFRCTSQTEGFPCDFFITDRAYSHTLMDKMHPMRGFLTIEQAKKLSDLEFEVEARTAEIVLK